MNARFIMLITACTAALALRAQPTTPPPSQPPAPDATAVAQPDDTAQPAARTAEQIDQLLGPIALYPDALVAVILPASTVPSDIVLASRYLAANGSPDAIPDQSWDDSVKSLAHYPEVVKWMDDNLDWTKELGETFVAQPADVMKSVQRLRAKAQAVGSLKNTPQQQVVMEGQDISIVPAQPDVIYVPSYDPAVVYVQTSYYPDPFLTFGVGFAVGPWLYYGCDWGQRVIWVGPRSPRGGWRAPTLYARPHYVNNPDWHHWRPSSQARVGSRPTYYRPRPDIVRPRPYSAVSPRPAGPHAAGAPAGGQARPAWPRLNNQGSRAESAPGAVRPQDLNGARPHTRPTPTTPAPNINGPHPQWNRGERREGGNAPGAPAHAPATTPQTTVRPNSGGAPAHVNAPHGAPAAPHPAPAPRQAPAPRPAEREKNQN